ncbi:MAG TPA: COX15/CtaA family protein [Planctomycetota bacterium]|jgi:cytochrome c oxidase assembly protein subunit 15|nr:COX15/CtaA family protein [Planctomycetota bacterium]
MTERTTPTSATASPWPRRLAVSTLVAAVPLVFFGGTVTTLHAGLAIDGWWILEPGRGDHFLWLYPVDKWFRDVGTFVEHTHRLFGSLVGLLAIATVVATWATDRRRLSRILSVAALLAVIAQGVIGGLRVLEQSEDLAFLHGAIGQAVFATLGASAVAASVAFGAARATGPDFRTSRLRRLSLVAAASVYLQIVAGAWLRHGGRVPALAVHGLLAALVVVSTCLLAAEMRRGDASLEGLRKWILGLLSAQIVLGVAALVVVWGMQGSDSRVATGLGSSFFPTLHVLFGGGLLFACVASAMWIHRLSPSPAARERFAAAVEGAR